ncbi:MAG: NAD(P)-binding domain-containing protein [Nocardioidaceae bacterium]|nr:NAD(P)-binding domain-containing protein [Nocardioidaceae bacterium]
MTPTRDYLVVGAGAIGGSLAHHLAGAGHRVRVVDADREHVEAIRRDGLRLVTPAGQVRTARVRACTPEEAGAVEESRVLLATKLQHVEPAAAWLATALDPDRVLEPVVYLCQNGLSHGRAARALPREWLVPALVNFAADVVAPGTVRSGGPGLVAVGELGRGASRRVRELAEDLAGFGEVEVSEDIVSTLWAKRILGALITATALVDADIDTVVAAHREVMAGLAAEVTEVALAEGSRPPVIDEIDPLALGGRRGDAAREAALDAVVSFLAGMTGKRRSGVFRDIVVRRRPTEATHELGDLLEAAAAHDVRAPLLAALRDRLGDLESGRLSPAPSVPADLGADLGIAHTERNHR